MGAAPSSFRRREHPQRFLRPRRIMDSREAAFACLAFASTSSIFNLWILAAGRVQRAKRRRGKRGSELSQFGAQNERTAVSERLTFHVPHQLLVVLLRLVERRRLVCNERLDLRGRAYGGRGRAMSCGAKTGNDKDVKAFVRSARFSKHLGRRLLELALQIPRQLVRGVHLARMHSQEIGWGCAMRWRKSDVFDVFVFHFAVVVASLNT
jgi:hypothetical protein